MLDRILKIAENERLKYFKQREMNWNLYFLDIFSQPNGNNLSKRNYYWIIVVYGREVDKSERNSDSRPYVDGVSLGVTAPP